VKVVVQRVKNAHVKIDGETVAQIEKGIVALVGIKESDNSKVIDFVLEKIINLRIFDDGDGNLNLSLKDIDAELLVVPNFTIYGDTRKGRRPSFIASAKPETASEIFDNLCGLAKIAMDKVQFGVFQADMEVTIINDGPVTLIIEKDNE